MNYNVLNKGELLTIGSGRYLKYRDQLNPDDEIWLSPYKIKKYLRVKYNLTPEQYYNIVIYDDINHKEYCKVCGKPVSFDRLSEGYHSTCSRECSAILGGRMIAPIMKDSNSKCKLASRLKLSTMFANGTHPMANVETHARSRMTDFIRKGILDNPSWFYVAISNDNRLKFGITDDPIAYNTNKCIYRYIHPLIHGTRKSVAFLEYSYKVHFNSRSEYFDLSNYRIMIDWIIKFADDNNLGTFNDYPEWEYIIS